MNLIYLSRVRQRLSTRLVNLSLHTHFVDETLGATCTIKRTAIDLCSDVTVPSSSVISPLYISEPYLVCSQKDSVPRHLRKMQQGGKRFSVLLSLGLFIFQLLQYVFSHWKKSKYLTAVTSMGDPINQLVPKLKLPSTLADFLSQQPNDTVIAMLVSIVEQISQR